MVSVSYMTFLRNFRCQTTLIAVSLVQIALTYLDPLLSINLKEEYSMGINLIGLVVMLPCLVISMFNSYMT